jgi:hypothetical protein
MQQFSLNTSELVSDFDAQLAFESIHLLPGEIVQREACSD